MSAISVSVGEPSAIASAAQWVSALLTGTLGTSIAILAIAWAGFAMLQGRIAVREGARVIIGCFILFGAPVLAAALANLAHGNDEAVLSVSSAPTIPVRMPTQPQFDPYARASLPNQ